MKKTDKWSVNRKKKLILVYAAVVIIFTIMTIVYVRPLPWKANDHVLGDAGDPLLNIYIISWTSYELGSNPLNLFNATMYYPNSHTLAYSDYQLANSLLAWPVIGLTHNPVLAHNFVLIFSFLLSAMGCFLLVDYLVRDKLAALAGGIIFGFSMYKLTHLTHIQLLQVGFIPLALLCLHLYTEKKKILYAALFCVFTICVFWSSWNYGLFFAFTVLIYLVVLAIAKRKKIAAILRRRAEPGERRSAIKWLAILVAAFLVVILVLIPFTVPYLEVHREDPDFERRTDEVEMFSADIQDFLVAPLPNRAWARITKPLRRKDATRLGGLSGELFVGLVPLLLSIGGLIFLFKKRTPRNRFILAFYATLLVLSAIMCLGFTLYLFGHRTGLPMPYRLLYYFFPGYKSIRTPIRMIILVLLSVSVLSGFGVKWLRDKLRKLAGARWTIAVVATLLVVLTLEMMSVYLPTSKLPLKEDFPPVYHWLADREGDAPTVVIPLAKYDPVTYRSGLENEETWLLYETWRIYYNTANWKKLVNGYSGYIPPSYYEAVKVTRDFPSDEGMDYFEEIGVEYIIVHSGMVDQDVIKDMEIWVRDHSDISFVTKLGPHYVYRLSP